MSNTKTKKSTKKVATKKLVNNTVLGSNEIKALNFLRNNADGMFTQADAVNYISRELKVSTRTGYRVISKLIDSKKLGTVSLLKIN